MKFCTKKVTFIYQLIFSYSCCTGSAKCNILYCYKDTFISFVP
ncbi:hypothetical protein X975_07196, partial [Stegodyphus mimosarum]